MNETASGTSGYESGALPAVRNLVRRFWPLISAFVAVTVIAILLVSVSTNLQLAVRGFVNGEANWAIAMHEAAFHLDRYAESGEPAELDAYRSQVAVLATQERLRRSLRDRRPIDLGPSQPVSAEMRRMAQVVHRNHRLGFIQRAFERWDQAGEQVAELDGLAVRLERVRAGDDLEPGAVAEVRAELDAFRIGLRGAIDSFMVAMGDTARRLRLATLWLMLVSVGSLAALGLVLAWSVLYRMTETEQRFRHLLNTANDGVIAVDPKTGRILGCNDKMAELAGRREQELTGRLYQDLFPRRERARLTDSDGYLQDGLMQAHMLHRSGKLTPVEVSASYTLWDRREAMIAILRDVTERRAHERRIEFLATHDSLTGLVNRREFERRAEALIDDRRAGEHALLYLDLDQFKVVNDTCGHAAGDELLRQLTGRLRRCVRDSDTLARLGGDEFGVLLVDCSIEQAERVAAKFTSVVNDWHFNWGAKRFTIGVSIGIVPLRSGGPGLNTLLSAADAACYAAKDSGRNRSVFYEPGAPELLARQGEMHWVSRLTEALHEERLVLFRQRIVPAAEGVEVEGDHWELLLRLRDEDGSLVEPSRFLPAAERFNIAPELDRRVLELALRGVRATLDQGGSTADVFAVNISGNTLGDIGFATFAENAFEHWQVPPSMICFEITETAAIASIDAAKVFIARMQELGARIALDDFGTGMSSFAYLRSLSVDYLKIDGSFVRDLSTDKVSVAMVRAIHDLGREIGVRTVAEAVESEQALAVLRSLGGDLVQGFALHRPELWRWNRDGED